MGRHYRFLALFGFFFGFRLVFYRPSVLFGTLCGLFFLLVNFISGVLYFVFCVRLFFYRSITVLYSTSNFIVFGIYCGNISTVFLVDGMYLCYFIVYPLNSSLFSKRILYALSRSSRGSI